MMTYEFQHDHCTDCGREGVVVDTTAGEVVVDEGVVATAPAEARLLLADPERMGALTCDDCAAETRRIVLTDRAPVRIRRAEWPIIARATWHDGEVTYWQANHVARMRVRRQPDDGRHLVYALYMSDRERDYRGGELLDPEDDLPAAIRRVGELAAEYSTAPWGDLIAECIGDLLPKEER